MEATDVYRQVANTLQETTGEGGIRLAAVNCESNLQQFCLRYGRLRNQFDLPVVLLLDPTDGQTDRYRGRMVAKELSEYALATDQGIRHVHTLTEHSFVEQVAGTDTTVSKHFWLVFFCTQQEPLCRELKPVLKRLAYSAKSAAKVGLVNCKTQRSSDGYMELEPFCADQGVQEVPVLMAFRKGVRGVQSGEVIPLLPSEDEQHSMLSGPLIALQAMEAVLRLSAPAPAPPAGSEGGHEDVDLDKALDDEEDTPRPRGQDRRVHREL